MTEKRYRRGWSHKKERKDYFGEHFGGIWDVVQPVLYCRSAQNTVRADENPCAGSHMGMCIRNIHRAEAGDVVLIF